MGKEGKVQRAFKFALDPTPNQLEALSRFAGASRFAYNFALGLKRSTHRQRWALTNELVAEGVPEVEARRRVRVRTPSKPEVYRLFKELRGGPDEGPGGVAPWHGEVSTWCFQSAWIDADRAWQNWTDSFTGKRVGGRSGYPRFKKKHQSRESFRLHHKVKKPVLRLEGYRRLNLGKLGVVRLHESGKRMQRLVSSGAAVVSSVTVTRQGKRWYASVLCEVAAELRTASHRQRRNGRVDVEPGAHKLAVVTSSAAGEAVVEPPAYLRRASRRLNRAMRDLSRTQKGSKRQRRTAERVSSLYQEMARQRAGAVHQLSKSLVTNYCCVVVKPTRSAASHSANGTTYETVSYPLANITAKRSILDPVPGELRRQLNYKTSWYGSHVTVLDRGSSIRETCSVCGRRNPSQTRSEQVPHGTEDVPDSGTGASGTGDSENACGGRVSPEPHRRRGPRSSKREDADAAPPRRSNPPTSLPPWSESENGSAEQ